MTKENFLKYENLVRKISNRYVNKAKFCGLDKEDLFQIGCIALIKSFNTFENSKSCTLATWIYKMVNWEIIKELNKNAAVTQIISLNTEVTEDLTLEDEIQDFKINIEKQVTERLILEEYFNEINKVLSDEKAKVIILKGFYGLSLKEISKKVHKNNSTVQGMIRQSRQDLLNKSRFIRENYNVYVKSGINPYANVESVVLKLSKIS